MGRGKWAEEKTRGVSRENEKPAVGRASVQEEDGGQNLSGRAE